MNKKSFYNAILAAGYITLVVSGMNWITSIPQKPEDNIFMPITMIALLVLSVALMAYLFFYQPVLLLLDGKREEAIKLFLGTVAIFAGLIITFFISAMFIIP
jgi:hypothetical protein